MPYKVSLRVETNDYVCSGLTRLKCGLLQRDVVKTEKVGFMTDPFT